MLICEEKWWLDKANNYNKYKKNSKVSWLSTRFMWHRKRILTYLNSIRSFFPFVWMSRTDQWLFALFSKCSALWTILPKWSAKSLEMQHCVKLWRCVLNRCDAGQSSLDLSCFSCHSWSASQLVRIVVNLWYVLLSQHIFLNTSLCAFWEMMN